MRIHSNYLTSRDIYYATKDLPGVYVTVSQHGSRTYARAFEVRLEGNGYARNTGKYGADQYETRATWDEWGVFLAQLFNLDANMVAGSVKYPTYRNNAHFDAITNGRFFELVLPRDTHKRHIWVWDKAGAMCKRCSAEQRIVH